MPVRRVPPAEASRLIAEEGYVYLDVRSIPEFDGGHPTGAYNVPLLHMGPGGMMPNAEFLEVVSSRFPKGAKIVTGCKMGGRSLRAAEMLAAAGYGSVVDLVGGFGGEYNHMRQLVNPGWSQSGLSVEETAQPGRSYEELRAKR